MTSHDNPARAHVVRTCVGCRARVTTRELLRLVLAVTDAGETRVVVDPESTAIGRGAHLHPRPECFEQATRRRAWSRAFRREAGPGGWHLDEVRDYLASYETDPTNRNWSTSS